MNHSTAAATSRAKILGFLRSNGPARKTRIARGTDLSPILVEHLLAAFPTVFAKHENGTWWLTDTYVLDTNLL